MRSCFIAESSSSSENRGLAQITAASEGGRTKTNQNRKGERTRPPVEKARARFGAWRHHLEKSLRERHEIPGERSFEKKDGCGKVSLLAPQRLFFFCFCFVLFSSFAFLHSESQRFGLLQFGSANAVRSSRVHPKNAERTTYARTQLKPDVFARSCWSIGERTGQKHSTGGRTHKKYNNNNART